VRWERQAKCVLSQMLQPNTLFRAVNELRSGSLPGQRWQLEHTHTHTLPHARTYHAQNYNDVTEHGTQGTSRELTWLHCQI
jgi:hypothetical protein